MMKQTLFKAGDKTILPLTPIRLRAGTSPRRTVDRLRARGGTDSIGMGVRDKEQEDEILFAYSVAQGW